MGLLFINGFLQISLVVYVWVVYKKKLDENDIDNYLGKCGGYQTEPLLRWICVIVYTGFCVADVLETFNMFTWLITLVGNPFKPVLEKMRMCLDYCCCGCTERVAEEADK